MYTSEVADKECKYIIFFHITVFPSRAKIIARILTITVLLIHQNSLFTTEKLYLE